MMKHGRTHEKSEMEEAVVRTLERRPEIAVPDGFAARVARQSAINDTASAPIRTPDHGSVRPVFARMAGYAALAAMTVVLVLLTKTHPEALAAGRGFVFAVEVLVLAQLLAVGLWLGMKSDEVS